MGHQMKLDPRKLADWQIAEAAEKGMKTIFQLAEETGLVELVNFIAQLGEMALQETPPASSLGLGRAVGSHCRATNRCRSGILYRNTTTLLPSPCLCVVSCNNQRVRSCPETILATQSRFVSCQRRAGAVPLMW